MNRRSMLQLLGLSPAAPALAKKVLADAGIAELAGVNAAMLETIPSAGFSGGSGSARHVVAALLANRALVPSWFDDVVRERRGVVFALDPDIANKRSWSMAVKIATQRQRNIERAHKLLLTDRMREFAVQEFASKTGIYI